LFLAAGGLILAHLQTRRFCASFAAAGENLRAISAKMKASKTNANGRGKAGKEGRKDDASAKGLDDLRVWTKVKVAIPDGASRDA